MCIVGISQCPACESEYESKSSNGREATLQCPNGHEWTVTDMQNIGDFHPQLAT